MRGRTALTILAALLLTAASANAVLISKPPDLGDFWQPLSTTGSYAYADCFLQQDPTDTVPINLGTWLNDNGTDFPAGSYTGTQEKNAGPVGEAPDAPPSVRFEIWGDAGGPDASNVLASTGSVSPTGGVLTLHTFPVTTPAVNLVPGFIYWFVATVVGEPAAAGSFNTGGHTQNSVIADNCTFWFSNDPAGINFDGQNFIPEMAFEVETTAGVPAVPFWGLLLLGLTLLVGALLLVRRFS